MPGAEISRKDDILQGINQLRHTFGISGTMPISSVFNILALLLELILL
jgi:hypothetical protein